MPRTSSVALAIAMILCGSMLHAGNSQANVPGWMKDLASQPVGTYPPRTDAVVLLDETTISVTGPGEHVETNRRVVRILRPEGHTEGEFFVRYGKDDKVLNCHAWSIDATGRQYEVKEKDFADVGAWGGFELYSDDRARTAKAPASDVGSVIAFESSVRRKTWIAHDTWLVQSDIPVKEARYILELPAGWEFKTAWFNATPQSPVQLATNKWQWTQRDVPGIQHERMRPPILALAGRMSMSYFSSGVGMPTASSWESIGNWDNSLTNGRRNVTPEVAEKVRQLTAGNSGFDATLRAIANFIQTDIRYVAIEIGIGGFQPHYAGDVFRNRYGDCKDMTTLMSAMLQAAGIRSNYVLVFTEHGVTDPKVPESFFNHSIIAIELPPQSTAYRSVVTARNGKQYLIFNATDHLTPVGDMSDYLQGNAALLMTESGGEIITIPLQTPESNRLDRTAKFTLNPDGTLAGEVIEKRTGENAKSLRAAMKESTDSERTKYLERYFGHFLNGAAILESNVENLTQIDKELTLRYKISSGKYSQNAGPLVLVRARVLGEKGVTIDWKDRKYPVALDAPSFQSDTFEIAIPAGFVVDDIPEPAQIDVGFASYKSNFEVSGSTIRYHREYVVKDPQVPLAKLADLKRLQQEIGRDENASVVLKKR
jgi:transglutaminase-like putative cysteine protease